MNNNPYKVLGVDPSADDETIKTAYRKLARKYHPDRYKDSDLADLANEKMKEINAAYEQIRQMRAGGGAAGAQTAGGYDAPRGDYGNPHGGGERANPHGTYTGEAGNYQRQNYSAEAREKFVRIRNCINGGDLGEAERLLSEIAGADRGAEWHFLTGCLQLRRGFYVDAQRSFEMAYRMEPTNNEYWQFKERMNQKARDFGSGYHTTNQGGCCDCDMCTSLICADCCCECMGGDLIPCC